MSLINNTLFETVYTDPSGQDWKVLLHSKQAISTGIQVGSGAAPLTSTGWAVTWTWSNVNEPEFGDPNPGTTYTQLAASGVPFKSYSNADAYVLANVVGNPAIDQSTVSIVSYTSDHYNYNMDMAFPGFRIRWEGQADDPNKSILGSGVDMTLVVDDKQEAILTEALMLGEYNLTLSIFKGDQIGDFHAWWHGVALPESCSMQVKDHKRMFDLSFSCGLALLNDLDWKDPSTGLPLTGQLNFSETIETILKRLPHFDRFVLTPAIGGAYMLNEYGTPLPVNETRDWDTSLGSPLDHMYCQAETFNEDKVKYDRKFEMRPDPGFVSTGHVLEDICKTLGMVITQWEGGWHLFSPTYLAQATALFQSTNDSTLAPTVQQHQYTDAAGMTFRASRQVAIDEELEDYAAPQEGMTKSFLLPFRTVKMTHERSSSDVLYGTWSSNEPGAPAWSQDSFHKVAPQHASSPVDSASSDLLKFGDFRLGYKGNTPQKRVKRQGTAWTLEHAYYVDSYSFDLNGGSQGVNLSARAQHKRVEDGVTGGGPNPTFFDGRYIGPDSAEITNVDLEAGETISIEMGGYVENGRLDEHIGNTYVFHHRIELTQDDGTLYRLRRHVITQDRWTDTGTERKTTIDGSNSDVDKTWAGDMDYYIKEYDTMEWVEEGDVTANEWEDCWYEVMSFHPSTTKTEGDNLATANIDALPFYGHAPMGTRYDAEDGILTVDKENRFAYVKADLQVELPGNVGQDEFTTLYTECGISKFDAQNGPRPQGGFAGEASVFSSRKADGTTRKKTTGSDLGSNGGAAATHEMPYTMGWNKFVIRYGEQGEKNSIDSYSDGGTGTRTYDAGSSRLGSRFVFTNPEYKGRIKVEHQIDSTTNDPVTFATQWRPSYQEHVGDLYYDSLHDMVSYNYLNWLGYVRSRFVGSWVKHPGTTQGGCPAPFLPLVTRCLDPDNAVRVMPYRMSWTLAQGFQVECIEITDSYEKDHEVFETGGVSDGGVTGGSGLADFVDMAGNGISLADQVANRPHYKFVGSSYSDGSAGSQQASSGVGYTGTTYGTTRFTELVIGSSNHYLSVTPETFNKFTVVGADSNDILLYGGLNLGRVKVPEPGTYLVEVRLNGFNSSSSANDVAVNLHSIGTVSNNTFTGDTTPKPGNVLEELHKEKFTSTGTYGGTYTGQVQLERDQVIAFTLSNETGASSQTINTAPEQLQLRVIKLAEQPG